MTPARVGFGKHHKSMYTGSMVGKGAEVFAVMGYVIANMQPDRQQNRRMVVELNPRLLAFILGEKEEEIEEAIEVLCSADPESRSKDESGRRLLRSLTNHYEFYVVNGWKYREHRDPEKRREQNRDAQRRYRQRHRKGPLSGEVSYGKATEAGASVPQLDNIVDTSYGEQSESGSG